MRRRALLALALGLAVVATGVPSESAVHLNKVRFVAKLKDALGARPVMCEIFGATCGFEPYQLPDEQDEIYCWSQDEFQRSGDYVGVIDIGVKAWCTADMNGLSAAGEAWYYESGWRFITSIGRADQEVHGRPEYVRGEPLNCRDYYGTGVSQYCGGHWQWRTKYHFVLWPGWYWASYPGADCGVDAFQDERLICSYDYDFHFQD